MNSVKLFLLYFVILFGGLFMEIVVKKLHYFLTKKHYKENHLTLSHYLYFLLAPLGGVFVVMKYEMNALYIFLLFGLFAAFLEWLMGFMYHQIVGERLWTYHKFHLAHYTSYLTFLIWGTAGVMFWLFLKAINELYLLPF